MTGPRDHLDPLLDAGVLGLGDVHTALAVARLVGEDDPDVVLAAALAVRAPRFGHTCIDLDSVDRLVQLPDEASPLAWSWPSASAWHAAVARSPMVRGDDSPLVLEASRVSLRRYAAYEEAVAAQLVRRAGASVQPADADPALLDALLVGEGSDDQRAGVRSALQRSLTVLVGGPGTGKTTTVAAMLATLLRHDPGTRIALAAPTGKAAARMAEALRTAAARLPADLAERLADADASTIHRLLGTLPGSSARFRHGASRPLPHDVVIIDETSMVSLPLMAKLLAAVRSDARLVLVGDPGQLASVEAGTVLGDVANPAVIPGEVADGPLAASIAVLRHSRRFPPGSPIDQLAQAIRRGDADGALEVLRAVGSGDTVGGLRWDPRPADQPDAVATIVDAAAAAAAEVAALAQQGDADAAITSLERLRVLCAHRDGPFGVRWWNRLIEAGLRERGRSTDGWYLGCPVMVTANDYVNVLFNGDLGVVVATGDGRRSVAVPDGGGTRLVAPGRLQSAETVHAMTIHKSQGSEFDHVVVLLPPAESPLATRELLYTAVTRARQQMTLVGDEAAIRAAIGRRVVRAGGLASKLWPGG